MLQTVTDVMGLEEVADRIQLEDFLWKRESRTKEKPPEILPAGQEPAGMENITECSEERKEFVAQSELPPKEE